MQILIHKNGQQLGPFSEPQVTEMLKSGQAAETDLAWSEGMETWKPLSSFAQFRARTGSPPPIPAQPPVPAAQAPVQPPLRKTEPLSIWSLVLGIISIVGCSLGGFLAAIPAVICGHTVIILLSGEGKIVRPGQPLFGRPPPRTPAFLE